MISDVIPLLLFSISATLTPGPNNFMLLNSGLHFGVRQSLGHYFGICLGFPLMLLIVALGFGEIFVHYPMIRQGLKILGSAYMLYLAWQILRSHSSGKVGRPHKPFSFMQALLFQWVNPKAWLMGVGAISMFTISLNPMLNAILMSLLFLLLCLPCLAVWLAGGVVLQKILKNEKHRRWFNMTMAVCLAASVVLIFIE